MKSMSYLKILSLLITLMFCICCADMRDQVHTKFSSVSHEKGEQVTYDYPFSYDNLNSAASSALSAMGFRYSRGTAGEFKTDSKTLDSFKISEENDVRYSGLLIVRVSDKKITARAICGKGSGLIRDGDSKKIEEALLKEYFNEVNKKISAATSSSTNKETKMSGETPSTSQDQAAKQNQRTGGDDKLRLGVPKISPSKVVAGGKVTLEIDYTIVTTERSKPINVEETIIISDGDDVLIPLLKKSHKRKRGKNTSVSNIVLPKGIPKGDYKFVFSVVYGNNKEKASGAFVVY